MEPKGPRGPHPSPAARRRPLLATRTRRHRHGPRLGCASSRRLSAFAACVTQCCVVLCAGVDAQNCLEFCPQSHVFEVVFCPQKCCRFAVLIGALVGGGLRRSIIRLCGRWCARRVRAASWRRRRCRAQPVRPVDQRAVELVRLPAAALRNHSTTYPLNPPAAASSFVQVPRLHRQGTHVRRHVVCARAGRAPLHPHARRRQRVRVPREVRIRARFASRAHASRAHVSRAFSAQRRWPRGSGRCCAWRRGWCTILIEWVK